jgi:hypothetical protein
MSMGCLLYFQEGNPVFWGDVPCQNLRRRLVLNAYGTLTLAGRRICRKHSERPPLSIDFFLCSFFLSTKLESELS